MDPNAPRPRALKWNDGPQTPEDGKLANLIPIQDTINFENVINTHYEKSKTDVKACLKDPRMTKYHFNHNQINQQMPKSATVDQRKQSAKAAPMVEEQLQPSHSHLNFYA